MTIGNTTSMPHAITCGCISKGIAALTARQSKKSGSSSYMIAGARSTTRRAMALPALGSNTMATRTSATYLHLRRLALAALLTLPGPGWSTEQQGQFHGAMETEYPAWFKDSFLELQEDIKEAAGNDRRLMLFFHQDGCPYCNLLVERNLAQKDIEEKVRKHFDVVALNLWGDRELVSLSGETMTEKQLAASAKVQFTPTLLFFDEQGEVVLRLNGYLPPENFDIALDYVAEHQEKTLSFQEFVAARIPSPSAGQLNAKPYFKSPPYDLSRMSHEASRPLAVFFEQKRCPNCDTLHNDVLADAETRKLLEQFDSVQLDMWAKTPVVTPTNERTTARQWAKALDVSYAPTIVYFDGSGKEVFRTDAFFKTFHVQSVMDYVLSGAYRTEPSFQRYISARADALREKGVDVDIWR